MEYFQNIDVSSYNKLFWKTMKPWFSNKCKTESTIILTEGDIILKNEKLIADTFNNYFADVIVLLITSKTMKV